MRINEFGQTVGDAVPGWTTRALPSREPMVGRLVRLEALDAGKHASDLHAAYSADKDARHWTYLPYGPFESEAAYAGWLADMQTREDPLFFAIVDPKMAKAVGVASYLRIDPAMGSIEVGHLRFGPSLQRTAASTEAMYLMMRRAFDELGYRRCEWKCDALNAPSVAAAKRLGFRFEGIFRQAIVIKGRNRDTAWFSITDGEWPAIRRALESWLDPDNFDPAGRQGRRLEQFMDAPRHD